MSRRLFLALAGRGFVQGVAAASLASAFGLPRIPEARAASALDVDTVRGIFTAEERLLLAAVQDHLLPSEGSSPGARDIRATSYLEVALAGSDVDPADREIIRKGCRTLRERLHGKEFAVLDSRRKERVLREFEDTDEGEQWLTLVLGYTLEAYVGDPSYGGNPD